MEDQQKNLGLDSSKASAKTKNQAEWEAAAAARYLAAGDRYKVLDDVLSKYQNAPVDELLRTLPPQIFHDGGSRLPRASVLTEWKLGQKPPIAVKKRDGSSMNEVNEKQEQIANHSVMGTGDPTSSTSGDLPSVPSPE
ncbi:unnamed protein product, partial [Amoebophrya sp. A25]|eukprot:GSA25T00000333001.1